MYVIQLFQDPDWVVGASSTELSDAQAIMSNIVAVNGVDAESVKIGVQADDGTITDYTP